MQEYTSVIMVFKRSLGAVALVITCVVVAFLVANLVDLFRPQTFVQGRDFRRWALLASFLIAFSAFWWARNYVRQLVTILTALGLVEVLICAPIWFFSGSFAVDRFFLSWFLGVNAYIVFPWLGAAALGFVWARRDIKQSLFRN